MMKQYFLPLVLLLEACSTCQIPVGNYESFGGSESKTTLALSDKTYSLIYEHWAPADYENRTEESELGRWTCSGHNAVIQTSDGEAKGAYLPIGENPLDLAATTKALVFEDSGNEVLSEIVLYPAESLE